MVLKRNLYLIKIQQKHINQTNYLQRLSKSDSFARFFEIKKAYPRQWIGPLILFLIDYSVTASSTTASSATASSTGASSIGISSGSAMLSGSSLYSSYRSS